MYLRVKRNDMESLVTALYMLSDAALSAFAVFFTQGPFFPDYLQRMQKHCNRNDAQSSSAFIKFRRPVNWQFV
jgi:hypothetical protein